LIFNPKKNLSKLLSILLNCLEKIFKNFAKIILHSLKLEN